MNNLTDEELYRDTLQEGLHMLCKAMKVDPEYYDTDQSDISCYLDCFKDAANKIEALMPQDLIERACFHLRQYAKMRHKDSGKWTAQEQALVDLANSLSGEIGRHKGLKIPR